MRIIFFGDIVGKSGRKALAKILPKLKKEYQPDLVMANAENLAHGKGITLKTFEELLSMGVDFCTSGNHVFDKPESKAVFEQYSEKIIRPANFSDSLPGKGFVIIKFKGHSVLVVNLNGQVFMEKQFDYGEIKNPFLRLNEVLSEVQGKASIKILDFHAEATSEKRAMGFWANGRLSAVLGTHTHVPTNDAHIFPKGTGYITDVGMVGAANSVIGVKSESAIKRLLVAPGSLAKTSLEVDEGDHHEIGFAVLKIDEDSGKCQNIENRVLFAE